MFQLTDQPIPLSSLVESLKESKAGALVTFEGWVRNHNQGKAVSALEYQVYEVLAQKEGARILEEAKTKFNLHSIACTHRHGLLQIGEVAVWVGASASHRNDAFLAARYVIDEIKHRLPIWKKEHYLNEKAEWVQCKDHAHHVHFHEEDYYQKQKSVVVQSVLKSKNILVVGAGGLGCPVLTSLAMAGVGQITVMDFDKVEISNLHRQSLYTQADVGEKKATVAATRLMALNPWIKISAMNEHLNTRNVAELTRGFDLILDCTDSLQTKFMLHDACYASKTPLISASIYRFEGQLRTFDPAQAHGCLRCLYPETPSDEAIGNCNDFGVLGASVNALGALQAGEAIQYLAQGKNASTTHGIYFDFNSLSVSKIKNLRKENCSICLGTKTLSAHAPTVDTLEVTAQELNETYKLVDIREQPDDFLDRFVDSSQKIAVYCHKGIRSRRLVTQYRSQGFHHFYSLAGGACSL